MAPNNGNNTSEPTLTNWDANKNRVFLPPSIEKNNDSKLDIQFLLQDSFNRIHRHQRHHVLSKVSRLTKDQNWCTDTLRYKLLPPLSSRFSGSLKNYVADKLNEILKKAGLYDEYYKYRKNQNKLERGIPTKNLSNSDYQHLIDQHEKRVKKADQQKSSNRQKAKRKYAEKWGITAHLVNENNNLISQCFSDKYEMGDGFGCSDFKSKQGGCMSIQKVPNAIKNFKNSSTQTQETVLQRIICCETAEFKPSDPLKPIEVQTEIATQTKVLKPLETDHENLSASLDRIEEEIKNLPETEPLEPLPLQNGTHEMNPSIQPTDVNSSKYEERAVAAYMPVMQVQKEPSEEISVYAYMDDDSDDECGVPWKHETWMTIDYGPIPAHGPLFQTDRFGQQVVVSTLRFDWTNIEVDYYNVNVLLFGRRNAIARRPDNFKIKDVLGNEYRCHDLCLPGYTRDFVSTREYPNFTIEMARARNYVYNDHSKELEVGLPYDLIESRICIPQRLPWFEVDVDVIKNVKDIGRFFTFAGCSKNDWKKFHCDVVLNKETSRLFVEKFGMSPHRTPS